MRALGPALLCLLVTAGCGDDFAIVKPRNPSRAADGLVFTRADGSSYELKDAVARCREDPGHPGVQVVQLTAPARAAKPVLRVEVPPGVHGTRELPLAVRDRAAGPADVTLVGLDPQKHQVLSGSVERAAGEVTVLEATCYPEPRLTITVDATLGGQSGPPRVRVAGGLASVG